MRVRPAAGSFQLEHHVLPSAVSHGRRPRAIEGASPAGRLLRCVPRARSCHAQMLPVRPLMVRMCGCAGLHAAPHSSIWRRHERRHRRVVLVAHPHCGTRQLHFCQRRGWRLLPRSASGIGASIQYGCLEGGAALPVAVLARHTAGAVCVSPLCADRAVFCHWHLLA